MNNNNARCSVVFRVAAIAVMACGSGAVAQDAVSGIADAPVELDIQAQPIGDALNALAQQSGLQVVFFSEVVGDLRSREAVGEFESGEAALEYLLADTGLGYRFVNERTVAIQSPSAAVADDEGGGSDSKNLEHPAPMLMVRNQTSTTQTRQPTKRIGNENSDEERELIKIEEIVVTGSRIRGAQSASPVVTIDRAEIDMAGFATVEEVIENLPQNFGAGASSDVDVTNAENLEDAVGGNVRATAGGTSVNLRGLGASATLVLLNGRRISPSGATAGFTNIGSIPVTAIERVEVLTDGASAIYGADAIAGVVNFILREDYEGAETRLRYGRDAGGDTSDVQLGQTFGTSWNSGSVLLSYEYFDREALAGSERAFTASSDLSPFGGTDWRQPGGSPANIQATLADGTRVTYAIPEGQDGTTLTPADFMGLENTQNLFNDREFDDLTPDLERHSVFLHTTQEVGAIDLFGALRFAQEETAGRNVTSTLVDFAVTDASPWFVDPTGTGLTEVSVRNYSISEEGGPLEWIGEIDTYGATFGAEIEFAGNWSSELTLNWSKEEALQLLGNYLDLVTARPALLASVNLSDPAVAFNPFSDGSNSNNRTILRQLLSEPLPNISYENELASASLDFRGDIFQLGGGTAQLATGVDFRQESLFTVGNLYFPTPSTPTDLSREIRAVYAELFLPIVGEANSRPGLRRLEASLAARYESYSDFGSSTNPKLGLLWSPLPSLTFRGTVGTSFRAPSLDDLDESQGTSAFYLPARFFGSSILFARGRNSELQAEEATSWTAGIQWAPEFISGMSLDVTYFSVDFTDRIDAPLGGIAEAVADPTRFPSFVVATPTFEQIAQFVNQPFFREGLFFPGSREDFISGDIPIDLIVDNRFTNLAESKVTGLELQLSYAADSSLGTFSAGLNSSYMFDYKRRLLAADPLVDEVDTYGRPVDFRARGDVGWRGNNWSVSGFVNYTDGYTDGSSGPARLEDPRYVDSWTTVDLTVGYQVDSESGFFSDTRLSLTTLNLFDEDPPFVDTSGGVGYDVVNANPMGRYFAFQLTKEW